MKRNTIFPAVTIATMLVASVIAYPFAQTATAAYHTDSSDKDPQTTRNNDNYTTAPADALGTTNDAGTAAPTQDRNVTDSEVEVAAGSNATVQYYTFTPQTVEIDAGESVSWLSRAELSDIHTVTFVLDHNLTSDLILPFAIPEQATSADFELLPPFNVGEPVITQSPDGKEAIVALNKVVFYPTVIDSEGKTNFLNGTDLEYTLGGTEKAINSGIILPPLPPGGFEQQEGENETSTVAATETPPPVGGTETNDTSSSAAPTTEAQDAPPPEGPPFPPVSSFTVTFEEPGTYPYFCAIHPWMGGQVIVREDNSTETSGISPIPK